jgi:hypothetical protein
MFDAIGDLIRMLGYRVKGCRSRYVKKNRPALAGGGQFFTSLQTSCLTTKQVLIGPKPVEGGGLKLRGVKLPVNLRE